MLIFMLSFVKNDYLKFIFLLIGLLGFVALVGFQPSAVRSAAMAILYYFLKILGRKPNTLNVVSFVLLFYIVVNPSIIMNISFQMSGFAVLGMIYFYYPIANGLNKVFPKFVSNSFAISISASLIVSPLTAYYFGIYSIISPFANFIVVPTMSLGLIYSIVSLVLLKIPLIGEIFISATEFFIDLSVFISAYSSNFKFAYSEGTLAIYISLAILIFGIYILSSKNLNNFIFKTAVSGTFIFFISFLLPQNKIEKLQIIPRQQAVIIDIPPAKDKKLLVIIDRKPAQYPIRDIALENYINNYNGKMQIAVCGNAGINLIDNLKKKVETVEIDLKDQEKLRHKLKINQYLSQIINYNVKTN